MDLLLTVLLQLTPLRISNQRDQSDPLSMAATMDDTNNIAPADPLATEHVCVDDIGTQLINIESVQQTIREQILALESSGMATSVLELKSLLPKLDILQISLRKTFDAHARLLIRDIHIFDLPDELLRKIFQHVAGNLKKDHEYRGASIVFSDVNSIMSSRLVCHRFCDTSSHLLLRNLNISITNASLAHLDEVSRHPTISRGVKTLRIGVGLYDPSMFRTFREFVTEGTIMVREHLRLWQTLLAMSHQPEYQHTGEIPDFSNTSDLTEITQAMILTMIPSRQKAEQYSQILRSWKRYIRAESPEQDEDEHVIALRQGYERYKQLLSDQQVLLQGNAFFQKVATAVARMPTVAGLSIADIALVSCDPWIKFSNPIDQIVQKDLLKTTLWSLDIIEQLVQPSVDFLYQLPLDVGRAGSPLTTLNINFTPKVDMKLNLDEEKARDVLKAAQHLQVLSVSCYSHEVADQEKYPSGGYSNLSKLVRLFLEAPCLQDVELNFRELYSGRQAQGSNSESIGKLVSLLPWTKLRKVALSCFFIRFDEFTTCLEQLEPGACIVLDTVNLLTGTWADLLDVLRTKADCASEVITPLGGEVEELDPDELYDEYFLATDDAESLATQYVRGILSENPLRQHHDVSDTDEAGEEQ